MSSEQGLRLTQSGEGWELAGPDASRFELVNEYLSHLLDRNYSPATVRAYGYDLLAFCRWLIDQANALDTVTTDTLLGYLRACREATIPGRAGPNVVSMTGQRLDRYAATTINRRLAAISGLFTFAGLRDPDAKNPVPADVRHAGWPVGRSPGCSLTPDVDTNPARRCGYGNRRSCRWRYQQRTRRS